MHSGSKFWAGLTFHSTNYLKVLKVSRKSEAASHGTYLELLHSQNKTPVLRNDVPVLGMKVKRGKCVFW